MDFIWCISSITTNRRGYTTVFRQDNPKPMKSAPPIQGLETTIKNTVLQELSQHKKDQGEEHYITKKPIQVNLKRLSQTESFLRIKGL